MRTGYVYTSPEERFHFVFSLYPRDYKFGFDITSYGLYLGLVIMSLDFMWGD